MAKYALLAGSAATRNFTLRIWPPTTAQDSPKSISIVCPGRCVRCTNASLGNNSLRSDATYLRSVRGRIGPAVASQEPPDALGRDLRVLPQQRLDRLAMRIQQPGTSRAGPAEAAPGAPAPVGRSSRPAQIAAPASSSRTPSTKCWWRSSAHCDILITSGVLLWWHRDDVRTAFDTCRGGPGLLPPLSAPGGPFSACRGVPFQDAVSS